MKRQGIRGASRAKKRFTTHADANNLRAPDLVNRAFVATRPDQLLGCRLHLLLDVEWRRLRRVHHRRLLTATRGLEGQSFDDRPTRR
jgi:hypothetical protein